MKFAFVILISGALGYVIGAIRTIRANNRRRQRAAWGCGSEFQE